MKRTNESIPLAYTLGAYGAVRGVIQECLPQSQAGKAWLAVGAAVTAYEFLCDEGQTLSEGVDRAIEKHPILTLGAIAVTSAHLANVLSPRVDPYHQVTKLFRH